MKSLATAFYERDPRAVAVDLLGRFLVRRPNPADGPTSIAMIVETEAYLGRDDLACHGVHRRTARNETMFGPPGHAYVYVIYGIYCCLNAVVEGVGIPAAVLIRSIAYINEPDSNASATSGPGRTCRSLGVTKVEDGANLCDASSSLFIAAGTRGASESRPTSPIVCGPRIGMGRSAGAWSDAPFRYWIADHPAVSGLRRANRSGLPVPHDPTTSHWPPLIQEHPPRGT